MMICQHFIYMIFAMFQQYKGTTAVVQDPCPSNIKDSTIVADICKSSSATKETNYGRYMEDSVVLRIMIQQDNCVCRVTIDNQKQPVYLRFGRYDESSTPEVGECGLAVDINHIPDMSTGNVIAPIECLSNVEYRTIQLLPNSTLQFKTRIISGTFNRGYCMRIYRDINSSRSQVSLIDNDNLMTFICDPTTTEPTPDQIPIYNRTNVTSKDVEYSSIKTNTILQTTDSLQSTTMRPTEDTKTNDQIPGGDNTVYIVVTACSSTVAMVLLVVLAITCIRKKSSKHIHIDNLKLYHIKQEHCCIHSTDSIDMSYDVTDDDRSQSSNNVAWRI